MTTTPPAEAQRALLAQVAREGVTAWRTPTSMRASVA
jgi:hypothetical protein